MEEVWLSRFHNDQKSIHLEDFPKTPLAWLDQDLEKKWDIIRNIRGLVTAAIELERQEKRIRSSLEASVIISVKDKHILKIIESVDFSEICITSDCEINLCKELQKGNHSQEFAVNIEVRQAEGEKCNRCWKYSRNYENFAGKKVCPRCSSILADRKS